jgi:elongation factor Ts
LQISVDLIKQLRERTGAGIMDCKRALEEAGGDMDRAAAILRERGMARAEKKLGRETRQGLVECYVHAGGRIGALVEVNCETDFVARNEAFKEFAHNIAMQVAATNPKYLRPEDVPDTEEAPEEVALLAQPYIRDPSRTVQQLVMEHIAKFGENITIRRFARFELGAD